MVVSLHPPISIGGANWYLFGCNHILKCEDALQFRKIFVEVSNALIRHKEIQFERNVMLAKNDNTPAAGELVSIGFPLKIKGINEHRDTIEEVRCRFCRILRDEHLDIF